MWQLFIVMATVLLISLLVGVVEFTLVRRKFSNGPSLTVGKVKLHHAT
jgi:hypothetical protein